MTNDSVLIRFLIALPCLFALPGCSAFKTGEVGAKINESFSFGEIPSGWQREESNKAQHVFKNSSGSLMYANSYCDYYEKNDNALRIEHIKKLGDVQIVKQEIVELDGHKGTLSTVYSKYQKQALLIYNYGVAVEDCYYDLNGITSPVDEIETDFIKFIQAANV